MSEFSRADNPTFKHIKPSELKEHDFPRFGLDELVVKGYEYKGTDDELKDQVYSEYDFYDQEDRINIILAFIGNKAVASLTAVDWSSTEQVRGKHFWQNLQKQNNTVYQKATSISQNAIEVIGCVTHPDFRQRGLAKRVYSEAVTRFNPLFILGQTKTPATVLARALALEIYQFKTFLGEHQITKSDTKINFPIEDLIRAHTQVRNLEVDKYGLLYVGTDLLNPTVPNIETMPKNIQFGFQNLITLQRELSSEKTAVFPLISVSSQLIS